MAPSRGSTRRDVLTGHFAAVHISSAVVSMLPAHREYVIRLLSKMSGVEIHHLKTNSCLDCHRRQFTEASGAPMISVTHFMDRDN